MTPDLYYGSYERDGAGQLIRRGGLNECVSIFGATDRFDVNTAHPALLASLGLTEGQVQAILERRRTQPFGPDTDFGALGSGRLRVGGNSMFTLRATARLRLQNGQLSDLRRTVAATVKFMPYGSGTSVSHHALVRQPVEELTLAMDLRSLLAFGTGVGIEIRSKDLGVIITHVRPNGVRVAASTTIRDFRERPAGEWGTEYLRFLRENGGSHLAATVVAPKREVIVRQIPLPGVARKDVAAAIGYQVETLHPYGEEEVAVGWQKISENGTALIGIMRRASLDAYMEKFAEAGVSVACFTFSAAALHGALRLFTRRRRRVSSRPRTSRMARSKCMARARRVPCFRRSSICRRSGRRRWRRRS